MVKVIKTHFTFRTKKSNYDDVTHIKMTFLTMESPQSFQLTTNFNFVIHIVSACQSLLLHEIHFIYMLLFISFYIKPGS